MPEAPARTITWRTRAALGVVGLAVFLAAVGLVLAIRQTRLMAQQRIGDARAEADRLAGDLVREVLERAHEALLEAADGIEANAARGVLEADPLGGRRRPTWLGDLFYRDAATPRHWPGLPPADGRTQTPAEPERLQQLVDGRLLSRLLPPDGSPESLEVVLLEDTLGDQPVAIAYIVRARPGPSPFIVAAVLDLHRLRGSMLEPLVARTSERIELVDAGKPAPWWSVPLGAGLSFWELRPTHRFVEQERSAARLQYGVFVGITVLAVFALLVVVWGLIHVVQKEIALSQLKSAFVADVSHELKTPLALIRLFGETLAEGRVTDPAKQREYFEIIQRESTRLTHLIDNILDFARIEAGRKEYRLAPVDVGEVVRSTYDSYRHDLDHNGFEHRLTVAADLPRIDADPDAISQALLNLMSNAVKYCDDERFLSVEVSPETRRGRHGVLIAVHDRGIGIAPEVRPYLFEGFYRAADERVRKRRGTGLGLAVVKHIVEVHGGCIDVESRLVKGSTFRIFLPQRQQGTGHGQ